MMNLKKVIEYYDQCHLDYKVLWKVDRNYSMHYGFFDENHQTHDEAVINMNRVLAEMVKIKSKDKILDAGCGVGGSSIWLSKNLGARVTGVSISKMQIEKAKEILKKEKMDNFVKFEVRNFIDTKFPNDNFDVVWAIESVCHAENKKDFLIEAKRILKNKGRIIIADGFLKRNNLLSEEKVYLEKWCDGWAIPNLSSIKEFKNYLRESGFKKIIFTDVTKNVMPSSIRLYYASFFAYPISKILQLIGLRKEVHIKNVIGAYYQHKLLDEKIASYGIFRAEK